MVNPVERRQFEPALARRFELAALDEGLTNVTRDETRHVTYGLVAARHGVANGHRDTVSRTYLTATALAARVMVAPDRRAVTPVLRMALRQRAAQVASQWQLAEDRMLRQLAVIGLPELREEAAGVWRDGPGSRPWTTIAPGGAPTTRSAWSINTRRRRDIEVERFMDTTTDVVSARVHELIGQMSPLGARAVKPDDDVMNDLGYDSVAIVELALVLETEFGLRPIDEEQAYDLVTVDDVVRLVRQMSGSKG